MKSFENAPETGYLRAQACTLLLLQPILERLPKLDAVVCFQEDCPLGIDQEAAGQGVDVVSLEDADGLPGGVGEDIPMGGVATHLDADVLRLFVEADEGYVDVLAAEVGEDLVKQQLLRLAEVAPSGGEGQHKVAAGEGVAREGLAVKVAEAKVWRLHSDHCAPGALAVSAEVAHGVCLVEFGAECAD